MVSGGVLLKQSIGKQVKVFYNDTHNTVSFKQGVLTDFDPINLLLDCVDGTILLPRAKCIRIELEVPLHEKASSK